MNIRITSAQIVTGSGSDTVILRTTLPDGCYPFEGTADVKMHVAAGGGADYVRKHLGLEPEMVGSKHSRPPFGKVG